MPFGEYDDLADCIAKNPQAKNPAAYCAQIHYDLTGEWPSQKEMLTEATVQQYNDCVAKNMDQPDPDTYCLKLLKIPIIPKKEALRHRDFTRIHTEFIKYYQDPLKGESEYYGWLNALGLNETRAYGQAYESFRWAKNLLDYIREDDQYKYYRVLVGFPIKSMNGNVYQERDLVAAALTLKGLHPSLNHKDAWQFTPDSRWGEVTAVDARYEDGAIEAIIKVSKSAVCPICNGEAMTTLIDSNQIVNVSLQGGCAAQNYTGVCDGFQFDDKGFSLLTKNVLPGIPLARIFPLEHIMVEALQTSSMTPKKGDKVKMKIKEEETMKKKRRIVLKPKIKEESDPAKMGQTKPPATGRDASPADSSVYKEPGQGTSAGPSGQTFRGNLQGVSQQTEVAKGTDPAAKKPEGVWKTSITEPENAYPKKEGTVGTPLQVKPTDQPALIKPSDPMPEVDSHTGPSHTPSISPDVTTSELPSSGEPAPEPAMKPTAPSLIQAKPPHDCAVGHHWSDIDGKCVADDVSLVVTVPAGGTSTPLGEQDAPIPPCPDGWHEVDDHCVKDTVEQQNDIIKPGSHYCDEHPDDPRCIAHKKAIHGEQDTPTPPCPEGWHEVDGTCVKNTAEQEEPCPDGYHRDEEGNCVPDEPLDERVKRIKAETREAMALGQSVKLRKDMRDLETIWASKYTKLDRQLRKSEAYNRQQDKISKQQRDTIRKEQLRCEDLRVEMRNLKSQFADATSTQNKYARLIEDLKIDNAGLNKKYHGALEKNLELSKKLTGANEEYLSLAKMKELLEDRLTKARTNAKKTLKLKV